MSKKSIFIIFLISTSINLQAKTSLVYMGAGGEGNKNNTIFDENIREMKPLLQSKNWDYSISINGGHKETEKLISTSFPNAQNKAFTKENYLLMLNEIKRKITTNQIKPGEQLLIIVDTHGAQKGQDKTHSISVADNKAVRNYDSLEGNGLVSLDKVQEIIDLSEARGIKLGLVDLSCHSGNTLNLRHNKTKTCLVTSTGPNHYAFAGRYSFGNEFIKQLKSSPHTLESAFLEARRESNDNSYPMISTSQAELARRTLYELITPYLQYQSAQSGKLTEDIINQSTKCYDCNVELNKLIKKLEDFRKIGIIDNTDAKELVAKLKEYEALRKHLSLEYKKLDYKGSTNKEIFKSREIDPKTNLPYYNLTFTWKELAKTKEETLEKMTSALLANAKASKLKDYENYKRATLSLKANILKKRQTILANNPDLKNVHSNFQKLILKSNNTFKLANDISKLERGLYNDLYFNSKFDKSNACATIQI